jgi:hypothetical protein
MPAIAPAVELTAFLVLSDKCHKSLGGFWLRHGHPPVETLLLLLRGRGTRV